MDKTTQESLVEIAKQVEWSKQVYMGRNRPYLFCCPICGGVEPIFYDKYELINDKYSHHRGHLECCLYTKVRENF
jgi:hypothetical protein